MHNAAISTLGLDAVYVAFRVDAVSLPHVMRTFEALEIAGNVTVPHKLAVASLLIRLTSVAKDVGAVNTFWTEHGRLTGDNTDVRGVLDTVAALGVDGPWMIVGTGGGARAAAIAAREQGVGIRVRSRQPTRAADFIEWARSRGVTDADVDDGAESYGVAINASPVGMVGPQQLPISEQLADRCAAGFDMVYRREPTAMVAFFRSKGKPATDGRTMLVAQGAAAFERFFAGVNAPREVMRAAVDRWIAQHS